jgi:hypothetical protein
MRIERMVAIAMLYVANAHAGDDAFSYAGPCDASAAVATSPNEFVVANDESNVLFTYRLGESKSIRLLDLTRFLDVGRNQEADIEGAAAIGSRIYWITSHGRNSKDRTQASRYRLFATERRDDSAQAGVGRSYKHLLQDLTDAPQLARYHLAAASKLAAEADGGLNIEGLAATPDGQLLIGFRNPLPDERALVVPLENPTEVVDGKRAKLGEAYEFNLGRRGVRSIEWVDGRYLIVAGPTGDEGSFALYRWSGKRGDAAEPIDGIDLGSLRPEALFAVPKTAQVVLLSDDGGVVDAGVECKKRPAAKQSFRSLRVTP